MIVIMMIMVIIIIVIVIKLCFFSFFPAGGASAELPKVSEVDWSGFLRLGPKNWHKTGGRQRIQMAVVVKAVLGSHFGVGEFTHFRTSFSGDWDVHWGYPF